MNSIQFEVTNKTKNNCVHLRVVGDKEDLGFLYLNSNQYTEFLQIFRSGCFNKEVEFSVVDPYNEDGEDL